MSSTNSKSSVYIGNLDERVSERVLYDILIQAGRVVDLHIIRDKETDKPRGFAFAEFETEEIAEYAVKLFSGLVTLYNRTLKFAISGQDKSAPNAASTVMPTTPTSFPNKLRSPPVPNYNLENSENSMSLSTTCRVSGYAENYPSVPPPPGVNNQSNGLHLNGNNFEYRRRVIGATLDSISRPRSRRYESNPIFYPS